MKKSVNDKSSTRTITILFILHFIVIFAISIISSFFSLYLKENSFSMITIGLIFGITVVLSGVISVFAGIYGDRFNKKWLLALGVLAGLLFPIVLLVSGSLFSVTFAKLLMEIGRTLWLISFFSYFYDIVSEKKKGSLTSMAFFVGGVSYFCAPFTSGFIIEKFGYDYLFMASVVLFGVALLIALFGLKSFKVKTKPITFHKECHDILRNSHFMKISFIASFIAMVSIFFLIYFPIFLKEELLWSHTSVGSLLSGVSATTTLFQAVFASYLAKFRSRFVMSGSSLSVSGFISMLSYISSFVFLFVANMFILFALRISQIKANLVVVGITQKKEHGGAVAFFRFFCNLFIAIGMIVSAYLIVWYGFNTTFLIFAVASFIVLVVYALTYTDVMDKMERDLMKKGLTLHSHHHHIMHDVPGLQYHMHKHHKVKVHGKK